MHHAPWLYRGEWTQGFKGRLGLLTDGMDGWDGWIDGWMELKAVEDGFTGDIGPRGSRAGNC